MCKQALSNRTRSAQPLLLHLQAYIYIYPYIHMYIERYIYIYIKDWLYEGSMKVLAALTRCENAFFRSCRRRAARTRSRSRSRRALGHHTSTPRRSYIDASYASMHIDASYACTPHRCYTDLSTSDLRLHIYIYMRRKASRLNPASNNSVR